MQHAECSRKKQFPTRWLQEFRSYNRPLTPKIYKGNKTLDGKKEDKIFNNIKESWNKNKKILEQTGKDWKNYVSICFMHQRALDICHIYKHSCYFLEFFKKTYKLYIFDIAIKEEKSKKEEI